jgi:hypothetical protein
MLKTFVILGAFAAGVVVSSRAYAIGGGPIPPEASPYAILVPQTVTGWGTAAAIEGRSVFTGDDGAAAGVARERRRGRRRAPEQ